MHFLLNKMHKIATCILSTIFTYEMHKMHKLVSTDQEAIQNVLRFQKEVEDSDALQERLSYARAWYAVRDFAGGWHFAPSKFIGYVGLDAEGYIADSKENDGRRTEMQLAQWSTPIEPGDDLYEELHGLLIYFLAEYAKAPSRKARISVLADLFEDPEAESETRSKDAIVDLMVAVAKTLPKDQLKRLKASLPK